MIGIKIKQANTLHGYHDAYAVAVHEILTEVYQHAPWTLDQTLSDMNQTDSNYYLAFAKNDNLIGFLATTMIMDEIEITNLAVSQGYQNQGVADLLLKELLRQDGTFFLEVRQSNQKAQKLYIKNGFDSYFVRKNYYQNPTEDALLMKREK